MYHNLTTDELIKFTKMLKILYVEDNKKVRDSFYNLSKNFFDDITVATNGQEGLIQFKNSSFDLVITDIKMPEMNGIEMIQKIKALDKSISIIVTTAHTETDFLLNCIKSGVNGYLLKPINHRQFKDIIFQVCEKIYYHKKNKEYEHSLVELVKIRTKELEETQKQLLEMANRDYMTTLYNRRYFNEVSNTLLKLSHREKKELSLLMIDIDNFKKINDTYGHAVGDKVIVLLAQTMIKLTRESDIVIRFGGEEFVILLPNANIKTASMVANNIRTEIENIELTLSHDSRLKFTTSIGVSQYDKMIDNNIESLVHRADEALYDAKRSGKNKVVINSTTNF